MSSGTILVGVDDRGDVVGVDVGHDTRERLLQQILTHTDPRVYADVEVIDVDGRDVLVIVVPPGDGPHLAYGRAFTRPGPATVQLSRDAYEQRLLDRMRESGGYERQVLAEHTLTDLDDHAIGRFVEAARARVSLGDQSPRAVLDRLYLLREDAPTVAGVLLFGTDPQRGLPQACIRARARRGVGEDSADIGGTVIEQIERAFAFVSRNLRAVVHRDGLVRTERPELPAAAVREVLANAVAHRDYRSTAPIQLVLDDDVLVVWNPGHLPPPITPMALRQAHPSVPTNPLVARALFLAGYIERWGEGTLRVIEAMAAHGNPEPLFEEDGGIRVTLPLPGARSRGLTPRQEEVLALVADGASTAEVAASLGVSTSTARNELTALEGLGLVRRSGQGRATRWAAVRP